MHRLGDDDYRRILDGAAILAADIDLVTFPRRAVDAVATVLEADFVSYNEIDLSRGAQRFLLRPDPAELAADGPEYSAFLRRFGHHPMVARSAAAQESGRDVDRFLVRLRLLGMVGNCCGEAELRLNLGLTVSSRAAHRIGISVNRSIRDFDDRDAACLDALKPHVVAAYRNGLKLGGANTAQTAPPALTRGTPLTRRENEVLYWVSMGKTNEEVSSILGMKALTVKKHLEHIYDKLGVPNRTAAARIAVPVPLPA